MLNYQLLLTMFWLRINQGKGSLKVLSRDICMGTEKNENKFPCFMFKILGKY